MATIYVRTTGNDSTGDGTSADTAYLTVQKGLNSASTGDTVDVGAGTFSEGTYLQINATYLNNKSVTVSGAGKALTTITGTSYAVGILNNFIAGTTCTVIFDDLELENGSSSLIRGINNNTGNISVNGNCKLTINGTASDMVAFLAPASGDCTSKVRIASGTEIVFTGLTSNVNMFLGLGGLGDINMSGCSVTGFRGKVLTPTAAKSYGDVIICNNELDNIAGASSIFDCTGEPAALGNIIITGNTADELQTGIYIRDYADYVLIKDNHFTVNNASAVMGIGIGWDVAADINEAITNAVIEGNTVIYLDDGAHGIYAGCGCNNALIRNNYVKGGDFQYVIKGDNNTVEGNMAYGPKCYLIARANNTKLTNNSGYATSDFCFQYNRNQDGDDPSGSYIHRNIFVAGPGCDYCVDISTLNSTYSGDIDENYYYGGDVALFRYNSNDYTLAEMLELSTYVGWSGLANDHNSVNSNPVFLNPEEGKFQTCNPNPYISGIGAVLRNRKMY